VGAFAWKEHVGFGQKGKVSGIRNLREGRENLSFNPSWIYTRKTRTCASIPFKLFTRFDTLITVSQTIAFIGEIVGKSGVFALKSTIGEIRSRYKPDFVIANADSATGGAGLGVQHAVYLRKLGVDCVTIGESSYYKIDMTEFFPKAGWVIRPANYPEGNPGRGWKIFQTVAGKIAVVQLLGQAGFPRVHLDNPFVAIDHLSQYLKREASTIVLDFHAAATAEKLALAAYADGKVSAIVGTHSKALTADARILPKSTAAITDSGRTGSILSVGGMDPDAMVKEFLTGIPGYCPDGKLGLETQGVIIRVDDEGKAVGIESFRIPVKENIDERARNGEKD
jgi:metallophosphoesterase (TIGR00282 family)